MDKTNPKNFELVITAEAVTSTDSRFTMDNISLGDNYKSVDMYFKSGHGSIVRRKYVKGERRNSNQTMPRIACQIFERQLSALTTAERENFPICQYTPNSEIVRGIFPSIEEFKKNRNTIEYLTYKLGNGQQFVFYCWNLFSTILFVQECLKRFGNSNDQFVLIYREKNNNNEKTFDSGPVSEIINYKNSYSTDLIESKNIIFHGAPGTGKSYLAKAIAADIISNGQFDDYTQLTSEQKQQIEFVQFHPSYDYSDFVEGLRPKINDDGSMGFELQNGIFTRFVAKAQQNWVDSQKSQAKIAKESSVQEIITDYFSNIEFGVYELKIARGTRFYITSVDENHINISIPENQVANKLSLNINELKSMLESEQNFDQVKDVTNFFGKVNGTQNYSYDLAIYDDIKSKNIKTSKTAAAPIQLKPFIFIIDEINRGEISKIFGELFFAIDPSYRGVAGEVATQYANLHENPDQKFSIPENVYIIGTMNDIDRSVDTFDFAMRRRFRFIEIKANEHLDMLNSLGDNLKTEAIKRLKALNNVISNVEELNENYHIGASYFLKLKTISFDQLWTDYLQPLLQDYIRGMYDEENIMNEFAKAYGYSELGDNDDSIENQR
ncbi:MAG: AAA family ATPase [Lactobacillus sp.]|uniref:McrB family protein n=1 Tax=Bombilactobacillus bombi TaxID=1303590 RepID=UPI0035E67C94|nr:AAA family ATPase [Lactobacillus sp.]